MRMGRCIRKEGFDEKKIEFLGNKMCIGNGWREPVNVPNGLFTWVEYAGEKLTVPDTQVETHIQELYIDTGTYRRKTIFIR